MTSLVLGLDILLCIAVIVIKIAFSSPYVPPVYRDLREIRVSRYSKQPCNPFAFSPPGENIALVFGLLSFFAYWLNNPTLAVVFSVITQVAASYYWGSVWGYKFRTPLQFQIRMKQQPHLVTVVSWIMGFSIIILNAEHVPLL